MVYGLVRGSGYRAPEAEDLTQAYFARFLEKDTMRDVRAWRGCLRPFLRVSVRHFLSNQRDRERAAKRGGGRVPLSLDGAGVQGQAPPEPADHLTPEVLLERRRAEETLARAVSTLRADFQAAGRPERFARLQNRLVGDHTPTSFGRIASEWGVGESAVRVTLLRSAGGWPPSSARTRACAVRARRAVSPEETRPLSVHPILLTGRGASTHRRRPGRSPRETASGRGRGGLQ
jgi:RNA polymerase sigma-70 factor (ECF subfamily)